VDAVPPELRNKYLTSNKFEGRAFFDVSDELRRVIAFRHLNLMQNWPFTGPFDFIFCRNVMIYFDKPTQEKLVGRFYDCLAPGGALFTGHSESLTGINHRFRYIQPTIYGKA
jgi:chemotaxis protein methyltransferase CheR